MTRLAWTLGRSQSAGSAMSNSNVRQSDLIQFLNGLQTTSKFYHPQTKLREGNVFRCVCLATGGASGGCFEKGDILDAPPFPNGTGRYAS